jgi:predicted ArsR family transcriptional regulator
VKDQQEQPTGPLVKQALSHPERFDMFDCIGRRDAGMDEGELAGVLGLTRAKVKYHLTVLCNADLIEPSDLTPDRYVAVAAGT